MTPSAHVRPVYAIVDAAESRSDRRNLLVVVVLISRCCKGIDFTREPLDASKERE